MKKNLKTHARILLVSSVIAIISVIYILFHINTNLVVAINIYQTKFETIHYFIGFSHLFILLFHLYAIVYIFIYYRHFSALKSFTKILLFLGIISLFSMGVEKIMIDEIAREYRHGLGVNELYILNLAYIINIVFSIIMFVFLLRTIKIVNSKNEKNVIIDEEFFIIGHFLGIFSGLIGLLFTLHMIQFVSKELIIEKFWVLIPFYMLFLTPYILAILYWLFLKRKQHIDDWYDEKQIQDMLKSSAVTLLLSIPGLSVLLLFQAPHSLFLIIYYVFLILILFSGGTLYFYKLKVLFNYKKRI